MADPNALIVQGSLTGTSLPVALAGAGTVLGSVSIDQTTPGTTNLVEARVNARRTAGVTHRTGVTAADSLPVPSGLALANNVGDTSGALVFNTVYNATVAAGNRWGITTVPAVATVTTTNDAVSTHTVRLTIPQVAGADYYEIYFSTAANPLELARITEAQRAAGGFTITAQGTVTAVGAAPAGTVDIRLVGTGLASNANPAGNNNAFLPASVTPVSCVGYANAFLNIKVSVTDFRSLPTLFLAAFTQFNDSAADWVQAGVFNPSLVAGVQTPMERTILLSVLGAANLVWLVSAITGQGTSVDMHVELC